MTSSRFTEVVKRYPIRIETLELFQAYHFPVRYTLFFDQRMLSGELTTEHTVTVEQALHSEFALATIDHDPDFAKNAKKKMKQLRTFLGAQYTEFEQAYLQDNADAIRREFIEIKPDPSQGLEGSENLERRRLQDLSFGMRIVYFSDQLFPTIYVGRVEEVEQKKTQETLSTGILGTIVLLQTDGHEAMADFFAQYLLSQDGSLRPGIYGWPKFFPAQSFVKPKRPGHLVTIPIKVAVGPIIEIHLLNEWGDDDTSK